MGKKKVSEKLSKAKQIVAEINREFKKPLLKLASEEHKKERISFGVDAIDEFMGGGVVAGNFGVIYGGESVGKSTLALTHVAKAQSLGKICVYIDLEHSFDLQRAEALGVNLEELILIEEADVAEEAMDIVIKLCKAEAIDVIVIDSIQAMSPKQEQETKTGKQRSVEDDEMALLARKLGKFFRVAGTPVHKAKASVLLIGQVRTSGLGSFITKDGLSGGHALKHWSVFTLYMRRGQKADAPTEKYKEEGKTKYKVVGFDSVIKIEKTKVSDGKPEGSEIHIPFYFEEGYNKKEVVCEE